MKIDWIELKDGLIVGFPLIPGFAVASTLAHDPIVRFGSVMEIIVFTTFYIIVRIKANKQSKKVYNSNGRLVDK